MVTAAMKLKQNKTKQTNKNLAPWNSAPISFPERLPLLTLHPAPWPPCCSSYPPPLSPLGLCTFFSFHLEHATRLFASLAYSLQSERLLISDHSSFSSNQSILKEIHPEYSLEGLMLKLKLHYLGHLMQRANSLEKTLLLGKIKGRRRRE